MLGHCKARPTIHGPEATYHWDRQRYGATPKRRSLDPSTGGREPDESTPSSENAQTHPEFFSIDGSFGSNLGVLSPDRFDFPATEGGPRKNLLPPAVQPPGLAGTLFDVEKRLGLSWQRTRGKRSQAATHLGLYLGTE